MSIVQTIPASQIVDVIPSVLGVGGSNLQLNGLLLTNSTEPPLGTVQSFSTAANVGAYFGLSSAEFGAAEVYFDGFVSSTALPAVLLFAQYNSSNVAGYVRGASIVGIGLAGLIAIPAGTIIVTLDGTPTTSSSIDLSGATSFSEAAALISTGIAISGASILTSSISGTTLTVGSVATGAVAIGQALSGSGVTPGTVILSGSGSTWTVSISQTASSTTITCYKPVCTYDSIQGAFVISSQTTGASSTAAVATGTLATNLLLTAATGAVTSPGAVAATPNAFMTGLVAVTQNWASFGSIFEPSTNDKVAFAGWTSAQNNRFLYAFWDTDTATAAASSNDTTSAAYLMRQASLGGWMAWYEDPNDVYFTLGAGASLNFTQINGRATLAFKQSPAGLTPTVTNATIATNLIANGYNFYGDYSAGNNAFIWAYPGQIGGPFDWWDSYLNQIWMNNAFQIDLLFLLQNVYSIPYNAQGYALIAAALQTTIQQALTFGAIRAGVVLSSSQIAEINNAAGTTAAASSVSNTGYYLQIRDRPTVRSQRGTPVCTLFYADGQSVQRLVLSSIEVQ